MKIKDRERIKKIVDSLKKDSNKPEGYVPVYRFLKKHKLSISLTRKSFLMPYLKTIDGKVQAPETVLQKILSEKKYEI